MIAAGCPLNGRSGHDAGRELLQTLYFRETGQALPQILFTARGKPYFAESALHFSITHTDRHAFCVLSRCNVGIDAEETDRPIRENTVKRTLSPTEQDRLKESADPRSAFLRLWVLKEAAAKCSGEGLKGFPNHTDFSPEDPRVHLWMNCFVALIPEDENEGVCFYAF